MTDFLADKRNAMLSYRSELTGERPGPVPVDQAIVPYLLELNAIPGVYSWSSCAGHSGELKDGRLISYTNGVPTRSIGYVWVRIAKWKAPGTVPTRLLVPCRTTVIGPPEEISPKGPPTRYVTLTHPFQDDPRKIGFQFDGGEQLASDMATVLEYLWGLARG